MTIAAETIKGLGSPRDNRQQHHSMFGESQRDQKKSKQKCPECKEQHPIWRCSQFKSLDVKNRWISAKKNRLCYRCLGPNHLGNSCQQKGKCNINGCEETHNRLLHEEVNVQKTEDKKQPIDESKSNTQTGENSVDRGLENKVEQHFNTSMESQEGVMVMALRTVPVKLRNGNREITVNALLDDGSTKSYINSDVAAELGLDGPVENVTVSTTTGILKTIPTMEWSVKWKV